MSIKGDQKIQKLDNAKGANMMFEDMKDGQKALVKELKNAGNINVQGNHMFETVEN